MSTATAESGGLYAVPAPGAGRDRLALWLAIKSVARKAIDLLLALPRGATGWVIRQTRHVLAALGQVEAGAFLGTAARIFAGLLREVGPFTTIVAVASVPAVSRAAIRLTRWLANGVTSIGRSVWSWVTGLLRRTQPGVRITTALETAGAAIASAVEMIVQHPVTEALAHGISLLGGLIRPLTQSLLVHRLLARLIPVRGLRILLEVLVMLTVLIPAPLSQLATRLATGSGFDIATRLTVVQDGDDDGAVTPADGAAATTETASDDQDAAPTSDPDEPRNRAERRAQQQAQARARRAPKR
jgi:hypothetical protein